MKSWKKRWENELDTIVPALRDDVKNAPIVLSENVKNAAKLTVFERISVWVNEHKKRFFAGLATATAAVVAACVVIPVLGTPQEGGAIVVEINPRAVFSVDKDGIVTAVVATNMDADVILSDEARVNEMTGESVEKATEIFVDYAAQLGYLNLNTQAAIRISGCGEDMTGAIGDALETYFVSKNAYVAVLAEELENADFCNRAGIAVKEKISELTTSIQNAPTLYSEQASEAEREKLTAQIDSLTAQIAALDDIRILNEQIEEHSENPAWFLKDYWTVKKTYSQYEEDFGVLMGQMETALASYETTYGEVIESNGALIENSVSVALQKAEKQQEAELLDLAQTIGEYIEKLGEYFQSRIDSHRKAYETLRTEISKTDYRLYVDGLVQSYGSLAAYWESVNS